MEIITNIENINEELILIENIFKGKKSKKLPKLIEINVKTIDNTIEICLLVDNVINSTSTFEYDLSENEQFSKYIKRYAKVVLYEYLSNIYNYKAPWGALTGIRPTKLYYEFLNIYHNHYVVKKKMQEEFFVSKKKLKQLELIVKEQAGIVRDINSIDLYINIPFCTSKCYYCSFISLPMTKCQNLVEPYIEALIKEIKGTLIFVKQQGLRINTIYFGGGTPTAIGVKNLEKILKIIPKDVKELTVEAGRPDTIDLEMLQMLEKQNVTRISINPQTFNNETLKAIGRNHTSEDVINVYNLARKFDFTINMDLIAGLDEETFKDFKYTLDKTISLKPDNITVHTLSIKRASDLITEGGNISLTNDVEKMIEYSNKILIKSNYNPYYLYRQKNMIGNLENIGYAKKGKLCEFNINSMEETLSVIACGANAISKQINYENNCIRRHANVKNIQQYIDRIDEMIDKKLNLFRN